MANNAMHTDSAIALGFHIGDHWRGAGDGDTFDNNLMRRAVLILWLGLMAGCASSPDMPLPATTPYDGNPKARKAFLETYRIGYSCGLSGGGGSADSFGHDPISEAKNLGWFYGKIAGQEAAESQHKRDEALREAQTK